MSGVRYDSDAGQRTLNCSTMAHCWIVSRSMSRASYSEQMTLLMTCQTSTTQPTKKSMSSQRLPAPSGHANCESPMRKLPASMASQRRPL